jgi:serine-aspartate repeat-containing protein C/D/E
MLIREVPPPGFILTTPPRVVVVSAEVRASSIELVTPDAEGWSAKSANGDLLTDASNYAGPEPAGNIGADSLLLSEGRDSYRISDFLVDRPVANLGNIPNFGPQNVGLDTNAQIGEFVKKNELIKGAIGNSVSTVGARDFSVI